jgi:hypothetical protein
MTKARTLANFISDNNEFADGTISVAEVSGAAPLASPAFTADASFEGGKIIINEVTGGDAYSEIRKTNGGSNFAIVSPEAIYLLVDSNNDQTDRAVVIGHNAAAPGSASALAVIGESGTVFNENSGDRDFRVESDTNTHALFVDAGNNRVGFFDSLPSAPITIKVGSSGGPLTDAIQIKDSGYVNIAMYSGAADGEIRIGAAGTLRGRYAAQYAGTRTTHDFALGTNNNERLGLKGDGSAVVVNEAGVNTDFRVESDLRTHMFFVDANENKIGMNYNFGAAGGGESILTLNSSGNGYRALALTNKTTNDDNKGAVIGGLPHANADSMWMGFGVYDDNSNRTAYMGGGGWGMPESTQLVFYTAPSYTQNSNEGVNRLTINASGVVFNDPGNDYDFRVESDSNAHAFFVDAGQGRIGINTSSPESTLCVNGNILAPWGNSGSVQIGIAARGSNTFNTGSKDLIIKGASAVSGAQAMQGGDVYVQGGVGAGNEALGIYAGHLYLEGGNHTAGVGTESGAGKIFMKTAGYNRLSINQYGQVTINDDGRNCDFRIESDNITHMLFIDASTDQFFIGGSSDNFSALAGGKVHLNTGSGWNGFKTEVVSANYVAYASKGSSTNNHYFGYMANGSNQTVGNILCTTTSTSYNTSSDYRLKENVVELTGATERLKQLQPKRFNFIATPDITVDGFLAHEAQEVVPEAVTGTHNEVREDGTPEYQGIDQAKLVPLLVATIKELEARITALENA